MPGFHACGVRTRYAFVALWLRTRSRHDLQRRGAWLKRRVWYHCCSPASHRNCLRHSVHISHLFKNSTRQAPFSAKVVERKHTSIITNPTLFFNSCKVNLCKPLYGHRLRFDNLARQQNCEDSKTAATKAAALVCIRSFRVSISLLTTLSSLVRGPRARRPGWSVRRCGPNCIRS